MLEWRARAKGADLIVYPELQLIGYPPEDLVLKPALLDQANYHLDRLAQESADGGPAMLVGTVVASQGVLFNVVALIENGAVTAIRQKRELPNYGTFDEKRLFAPGPLPAPITFRGVKIGVPICEDIWFPFVTAHLRAEGAEILISPNGSPFEVDKDDRRLNVVAGTRVRETGLPLVFANQLGGQDELVFDGGSFLLNKDGEVTHQADLSEGLKGPDHPSAVETDMQLLWEVLVVGLRDYVAKTGQKQAVLGLSGGIDSALCAAIAAAALGPENVFGVGLPSRYSSEHSLTDAQQLALNLGINYRVVEIDAAHQAFEDSISLSNLAAENIQARIRAVILMGISNTEGQLLLTTGNKSEIAVGYSTMYGDSAGGFAPIKDLYKTQVWDLARWLNANSGAEQIPTSSIDKPPSAELRPGQKDADSLPDYKLLDEILRLLIEKGSTVRQVAKLGFELDLVQEIDSMVRKAEWKRSQGAIGTKVSAVAFGTGRRVPLTTRFEKL
jgi:NAD+ synthase